MGYPNILDDVLYLNNTVPSLVTRTLNIESLTNKHDAIFNGNEYITNNLRIKKTYNCINLHNPDVANNTQQVLNAGNGWATDCSIVACALDDSPIGQVVLGRQYMSGSDVLGNCILEHYNGDTWASVSVGHQIDGSRFAKVECDTPSKTDKSSKIATTNWVKDCIPLNLHAYGYWNKTYLAKSYNCSMAEESPGMFRVTFHSPTADSYYMVAVSGEYGGAGTELFGVYSNTTTGFAMDVRDHTGTAPAISTGIVRFFVWA